MRRIDLSQSKLTEITKHCFAESGLEQVLFPSTLKIIAERAFRKTKLKKMVLPEGLEFIEEEAFENCDLEEVKFPESIMSIGRRAFMHNPLVKIIGPEKILHEEDAFEQGYEWEKDSDRTYRREVAPPHIDENDFRDSLRF